MYNKIKKILNSDIKFLTRFDGRTNKRFQKIENIIVSILVLVLSVFLLCSSVNFVETLKFDKKTNSFKIQNYFPFLRNKTLGNITDIEAIELSTVPVQIRGGKGFGINISQYNLIFKLKNRQTMTPFSFESYYIENLFKKKYDIEKFLKDNNAQYIKVTCFSLEKFIWTIFALLLIFIAYKNLKL